MQLVLSTPAFYSLELTPSCNNCCPGCCNVFIDATVPQATRDASPPLSAAQWRALLAKIHPHAERVRLTGGEPTLHPEFTEIVRVLAEFGISFSIFTNACWQHPDQLVALLKTTPQCVGLLISLHGADAETHEAFSGMPGSFAETVCNIRLAARAGLKVATSTVVFKQNFDKLADIVAFSAALGADHAVVNRYLGASLPAIEPSYAELQIAVQTAERLRREGARVKFGNGVPQCFVTNSSTGCLAGVAYCAVSPWGELRPCNHSPTVAGDLLTQPLEQVWRSAAMENWRSLMPRECETTCSMYPTCHGGCRALIETRDDHRDPLRGAPLPLSPRSSKQVTLYESLRPIGLYHLRQEDFGVVLLRGNKIAPLAFEDAPILAACDGIHTLRDIQQRFGARGLQIVVQLHQQGLIELRANRDRRPRHPL
jgi:radical SAM protein with 4Fe4S-binding SPASM domain